MLDKSIPYRSFIMVLTPERAAKIAVPELPEGFVYRFFRDGDEKTWARIETSVLEFPDEDKAAQYYANTFLPRRDELPGRCVFIDNPDGLAVATATAWNENEDDPAEARGILHWVSCDPSCQGQGLGRAVVAKALSLFPKLEPGREIFLHTQTWSHRAVWLYHTLGFRLCRERTIFRAEPGAPAHVNEFAEGLEVLRTVMDKTKTAILEAESVR